MAETASNVQIPRISQEGVAGPALETRKRENVPTGVRREVTDRDGECCTFVGDDGHVCGTRYAVQFHHRIAWAHGGSNRPENLTLHCGPHIRLVATRAGLVGRTLAGPREPII